MRTVLLIIFSFLTLIANAQNKKQVEAICLSTPLVIDAELDEDVYQKAQPAKDFVQLQPFNGKPSFQPTEAYFFYDQTAIYVGAILYDSSPDSIFDYLTARDDIGMSDYFGVYIDPYNQGQLAYGFFITPAGVQTDIKATKSDDDNEDGNWDAVWESKTKITEKGWIVEMRIPYSALRFPEKDVHTWGLNMFRNIRRYNSNNSWNFVDRKVSGFIHQEGELTNIKNIKPPVRLSLSPYASNYVEFKGGESKPKYYFKGGMDIKYGLSESFTLDMMLIPDFGQIQSDDKELNLSPYELYFDEKRQFFTEGTELFQRGDIFYSRRIGAGPKLSDKKDNETETDRPSETQLVNATKISGRTKNEWGIGMLNAMSLPSYTSYTDTNSHTSRQGLVQPFTNYNVSVVDKSLKNNGYISLINTNMYMFNNPFKANVTATEFQLRNKAKTFAIKGKGGLSYRGENNYETGYYSVLGVEKNGGKLNYGVTQSVYSDTYNPNDMGYLMRNNEIYTNTFISYKIIEPFWKIRECDFRTWYIYRRIYNPSDYFGSEIGGSAWALFKNNYYFYLNVGTETDRRDYFETRVKNRFFLNPQYYWIYTEGNTDQRKDLWVYLSHARYVNPGFKTHGYWGQFSVFVRLGKRLNFNYHFQYNVDYNDRGFADKNSSGDSIYFVSRNVLKIENIIETSFALNAEMSFRIRARHYWKGVDVIDNFMLQNNGTLKEAPFYQTDNSENYNTFNIDFGYRWIFAPGSELSLSWKNSADNWREKYTSSYMKNLDYIFGANQTNTISLKILYYIDYNKLRRRG